MASTHPKNVSIKLIFIDIYGKIKNLLLVFTS